MIARNIKDNFLTGKIEEIFIDGLWHELHAVGYQGLGTIIQSSDIVVIYTDMNPEGLTVKQSKRLKTR